MIVIEHDKEDIPDLGRTYGFQYSIRDGSAGHLEMWRLSIVVGRHRFHIGRDLPPYREDEFVHDPRLWMLEWGPGQSLVWSWNENPDEWRAELWEEN